MSYDDPIWSDPLSEGLDDQVKQQTRTALSEAPANSMINDSVDRRSLAEGIRDVLISAGHWVPKRTDPSADLITAVARAVGIGQWRQCELCENSVPKGAHWCDACHDGYNTDFH